MKKKTLEEKVLTVCMGIRIEKSFKNKLNVSYFDVLFVSVAKIFRISNLVASSIDIIHFLIEF